MTPCPNRHTGLGSGGRAGNAARSGPRRDSDRNRYSSNRRRGHESAGGTANASGTVARCRCDAWHRFPFTSCEQRSLAATMDRPLLAYAARTAPITSLACTRAAGEIDVGRSERGATILARRRRNVAGGRRGPGTSVANWRGRARANARGKLAQMDVLDRITLHTD